MLCVRWGFRLVISLVVLGVCAGQAPSQDTPNDGPALKDGVAALIDKLPDIAEGDMGYMPTMSGSRFLPLGTSEATTVLLGGRRPAASSTMRELVKGGAAAVPQLIAHLDDRRPTKISITHRGGFGGMSFSDACDYNSRTQRPPEDAERDSDRARDLDTHTVTVGDLCFVALGQIVNRRFNAVRYQPTAIIVINSPTRSEALRTRVKEEWGDLTPEQHKESLVRDFREPDYEERRIGACLRLGYYYPETLEPLVLKQLAEPRYDVFEVNDFIRDKLYHAKDATERKELFGAFIAKRGEVARQAILVQLFWDLHLQKPDEEASRVCLVDLYGYPKEVKIEDRPHLLPLNHSMQARFINALVFFSTPKIDEAVRRVLHSTDEDYLARACARYLVGRGADADIREYVEQRLEGADASRRQELERMRERLGWTPLHVAAEIGEPDRVESLIVQGADINARGANGQTPLHVAADHGSFGAIRVLLARKADPNIKDQQGRTPVQLGLSYHSAVEMLVAGGAEPPDIFVASGAGRADSVEKLLEEDQSLARARRSDGETPLHIAARRDHVKVAEMLLASGADVNAINDENSKLTPLHRAASYAGRDMVTLLLAHKADRNAEDSDGKTALDFARESRNEEVIRLLEKEE